jgi:hypothetical protein
MPPLRPTGSASERSDSPEEEQFLRHRVRTRVAAWRQMGASSRILQWVQRGVRIQFTRRPPQSYHMGNSLNNLTPPQQEWWVQERLRLLKAGAWEPATCDKYVSKAFLVPKPGANSWRLVLDLRHLNTFCSAYKMRMETLKKLQRVMRGGEWMASFDLKDGFYALGIAPEHRKYFTFNVNGELLQYAALPMGWNGSPYVFTKFTQVLTSFLRSPKMAATRSKFLENSNTSPEEAEVLRKRPGDIQGWGVTLLHYLDDFLIIARTQEELQVQMSFVESAVEALGLTINYSKSNWSPTQDLKHLGLGINSARNIFYVTADKKAKIRAVAKQMLCVSAAKARWVTARSVASLTGLAQSVYLAVPPARFHLRSLHECLSTKKSWSSRVKLSRQALFDLQWWTSFPDKWNGRAIWRSPVTASLHTDASMKGWGGVVNCQLPAHGFWRAAQQRCHITLLELKAVRFSVESFLEELRGREVLHWCDNQAVVQILTNVTSRSPAMMRELRKLWRLLDMADISLRVRYIRSAANVWADQLSRRENRDDWMLNWRYFNVLETRYGPHSVERFATANNTHLARFNSEFNSPGSEGVDAMAISWEHENNFINPPWSLLDKVAQKLREEGAQATVVAPYWVNETWFRELQDLASEITVWSAASDLFLPGWRGSSEVVGPPSWDVAIFRVPGRPRM